MSSKIETTSNQLEETVSTNNALATEQFADTAHKKVDQLAEAGAKAEQKVRSATAQAGHRAEELSAEALDTATDAVATAKKSIEENPLVAAGAAFAVGFLLSAILRR